MKELYELKEMLCDELKQYGEKDLTTGSLDVVDKLAHAIKNIDKIIENSEEMYSGMYPMSMNGRSYRGRSYAQRRDSMGRYSSRRGYSRDDNMVSELRDLMNEAPDERTRMEFQKFISKMEQNM